MGRNKSTSEVEATTEVGAETSVETPENGADTPSNPDVKKVNVVLKRGVFLDGGHKHAGTVLAVPEANAKGLVDQGLATLES